MRAKGRLITAIWAILLIVALAVPLVSAPPVLAARLCNLTVISDGCCNVTVAWDSVSHNISAGGNQTFYGIDSRTEVTLTAHNTTCCDFLEWTGNVSSPPNTNNPITIQMDSDKTVTASCTTTVPPPPVGGGAYPVNKFAILAPWIAVALLLAGGISWLALRRRRAQS